jgi:hypothetical protein
MAVRWNECILDNTTEKLIILLESDSGSDDRDSLESGSGIDYSDFLFSLLSVLFFCGPNTPLSDQSYFPNTKIWYYPAVGNYFSKNSNINALLFMFIYSFVCNPVYFYA